VSAWETAGDGKLGRGAAWFANKGWKVMPCHGIVDDRCTCNAPHKEPKDVGKHPASFRGQLDATSDTEKIAQWWEENPDYNIGVHAAPSGFFVIDIDPRSGGDDSFLKFEELVEGELPPTIEAQTGVYSYGGKVARGRHLFYKCSEDENLIGNLSKEGMKGIDIKHNGYVLIAPSRHFSGTTYDWKPGHAPWEIDMAEAPEKLINALRKRSRGSNSYRSGDWSEFNDLEFKGEKIDIEKLFEEGIEEGERAVTIYALGCALANKIGTDQISRQAIETMMIRFNHEMVKPPMELEGSNSLLMHVRRAIDFVADNPVSEKMYPGLGEWEQGKRWAEQSRGELSTFEPSSITGASSIGASIAQDVESGMSLSEAANNIDGPADPDDPVKGTPGKRTLTDVGNGRRLVDTYGSAIRYTPGLGWFHWDGQYWKPDSEEIELQELSKGVSRAIVAEVINYSEDEQQIKLDLIKWATQAKSASRLTSMRTQANSDPRIQAPIEKWDGDVNLLGVTNGVIDLKTGNLLQGRPELYITKRAQVAYTPGLKNVRWEQFIDFATGGDKELQDWIQRAVGYTLTGLSNQDVLFLVYGPAGSGKNTFVETVFEALGAEQYAGTLPSEELAAQTGAVKSSSEYYMAALRGKRMIWVDELPESERINENRVKALTGSSTLNGRNPGGEPFSFKAQGKLWITTNHRPIINDDAMWRRLRPIPWSHVSENPDPDLKAYLTDPEGGLPAVLSWAVEGAIKYLNSGARDPLGWCTAVSQAAEIYRKNEDRIGLFLDEETMQSEGASLSMKSLFSIYRTWSEDRGERSMTQIAFHRKLQDRGLQVVGQGARAEIQGFAQRPRVVPTSTEVNWSLATKYAN
jgi:putative DNA primase/helicase